MDTTTRERNARNHLKKLGYALKKTPARHWTRAEHGVGYHIADSDFPNAYITGDRDYSMTLEDIEEFIAGRAAQKVDAELRAVLRSYTGFGGDRFVEVAAAMVREAA